ncbi:uncharacterized protein LOC131928440 isoform X2 [Physella acuta]|uniref:uncharacterized protein LOC131928440 isoform X2 n=1 Tax=Physella acuta TaxID=109671 RepID=UPI0027DD75C3|nr:uncharacterized protein LOC131928440 isoform X2 [Physella acuta]
MASKDLYFSIKILTSLLLIMADLTSPNFAIEENSFEDPMANALVSSEMETGNMPGFIKLLDYIADYKEREKMEPGSILLAKMGLLPSHNHLLVSSNQRGDGVSPSLTGNHNTALDTAKRSFFQSVAALPPLNEMCKIMNVRCG